LRPGVLRGTLIGVELRAEELGEAAPGGLVQQQLVAAVVWACLDADSERLADRVVESGGGPRRGLGAGLLASGAAPRRRRSRLRGRGRTTRSRWRGGRAAVVGRDRVR